MASLMEPTWDMDKLSYEIFSILESKFLFSPSPPATPAKPPPVSGPGKVRVLSIDAAGDDGILAAAALSRLESSLRKLSGDSSALISDFFDLAAGSGAGGFLAALLFIRRPGGGPPFPASAALRLLLQHRRRQKSLFRVILRRSGSGGFRRVFGNATLRDSVKPLLVPCYDLRTGAVFMFSRADAMESEAFDFHVADVCDATCATARVVQVATVDGRRMVEAVGGGVGMGSPAAAAVTHVLNNAREFPGAAGVEDLLVVSIGGTGEVGVKAGWSGIASPSPAELVQITGKSDADMVDQALTMAFGHCRTDNYIRIQANVTSPTRENKSKSSNKFVQMAEQVLAQWNVESMLFRGRKVSEQTNAEKLERFAGHLIKEHERRMKSDVRVVVLKQALPTTPRTSSATTTTQTVSSVTSTSSSPRICHWI